MINCDELLDYIGALNMCDEISNDAYKKIACHAQEEDDDTDALMIFINYDFINWNEYIKIERGNIYKANTIKQNEKQFVMWTVKEKWAGGYPITLTIRPYFKDKRRDLDNYRLKGLIDGLVAAGVIKNDNLTCIDKIIIEPIFEDKRGVFVEIKKSRKKKEE